MPDDVWGVGEFLAGLAARKIDSTKSYSAVEGEGPLSIASNLDGDNKFAAMGYLAASGQMKYDAKANRWITHSGQTYTSDLGSLAPEVVERLDEYGRKFTSAESKIDSQRAALARAQTMLADSGATSVGGGISPEEVTARYFANGVGRYSTYQAQQRQAGLDIAAALGGESAIYDTAMAPETATGAGNPVIGSIAGALGEATMSTVRIAKAVNDDPVDAMVGVRKKIWNFGPETFNIGAQAVKLVAQGYVEIAGSAGLISTDSVNAFRQARPYQITPLFTYDSDAQIGGAFLADLGLGFGVSRYGNHSFKLADTRLTSGYMPLQLVPPKPTAYSVAFEMKLDPIDFGRREGLHYSRANTAFHEALTADPAYAAMMENLIPGVTKSVSSVGRRATPPGWTWEHASSSTAQGQFGVMRLSPSAQHSSSSPWWRIFHPDRGASGGYAEWARPAGAPKR